MDILATPCLSVLAGCLHWLTLHILVEHFDQTYISGHFRQWQQKRQADLLLHTSGYAEFHQCSLQRSGMFIRGTLHGHALSLLVPNNISEGWNNRFASLIGEQHPSVWKLIEAMQISECAHATWVLLQLERGVHPKQRGKKVYKELQKQLETLCHPTASGEMSLSASLGVVAKVHKVWK